MKHLLIIPVLLLFGVTGAAEPVSQWELKTDDTRIALRVHDNQIFIANLQSAVIDQHWVPGDIPVSLMSTVWLDGGEHKTQWTFAGADQKAQTLTLTFQNAEPKLLLRSIWRARPGRGPIEHWIEIENESPQRVTIPQQESLQFSPLAMPDPKCNIWWIKRGGS